MQHDRSPTRDLMTTDHASQRTVHSGAHSSLVGSEVLVLDGDERVHAGIQTLLVEARLRRGLGLAEGKARGLRSRSQLPRGRSMRKRRIFESSVG